MLLCFPVDSLSESSIICFSFSNNEYIEDALTLVEDDVMGVRLSMPVAYCDGYRLLGLGADNVASGTSVDVVSGMWVVTVVVAINRT